MRISPEEKGWLMLAIRSQLKRDRKSQEKFTTKFGGISSRSGLAKRLRVGPAVAQEAIRLECALEDGCSVCGRGPEAFPEGIGDMEGSELICDTCAAQTANL